MVVAQALPTKLEELTRCKDLVWTTIDDQNCNGSADEMVTEKNKASQVKFAGLIHAGQHVFLVGDQSIGQIEKLMPGDAHQVSYVVIRTRHFWGRHKLLPLDLVSSVSTGGVSLSIDHDQFQALAESKTDAALTEEVESALWNDEVLRVTAYPEVDVRVNQGILSITGHIMGMMSQDRIEKAVGTVTGLRGVRIHLVLDDKLLLNVAEALVKIERVEGKKVFAQVENGVVVLSGEVVSAYVRGSAEQYAAHVPGVRGVINNIAVPGVDLAPEDQRFLQPAIGVEIFFRDSLFGFVKQVIINRNNRRVTGIIIQGRFPDKKLKFGSMAADQTLPPERLAVIPVSVIRYLTSTAGFLLIDSTETTRYQDFDPAGFVAPDANWAPPYPYCIGDVSFGVEK